MRPDRHRDLRRETVDQPAGPRRGVGGRRPDDGLDDVVRHRPRPAPGQRRAQRDEQRRDQHRRPGQHRRPEQLAHSERPFQVSRPARRSRHDRASSHSAVATETGWKNASGSERPPVRSATR